MENKPEELEEKMKMTAGTGGDAVMGSEDDTELEALEEEEAEGENAELEEDDDVSPEDLAPAV